MSGKMDLRRGADREEIAAIVFRFSKSGEQPS
jgi:hypothetical protein